ncbi:PREDICTED: UPF0544 protein C5orf45 homolog [Buceros rhinoceros silvestris]|uniref:UPF0544 protein C5orf45 homolog n=1 Tax=Buceros rhinoceros silvestris TaxID=175836 RepID=UPI000529319B|nr:PREDICTED: UPF0544 protein C5orf45 homolog [Buceros rhinoceros silvestris]
MGRLSVSPGLQPRSVPCRARPAAPQASFSVGFLPVYGQGSGLDCRRHVQKLNLLQGEAEEAIGWTSRCVEDSVNDSKNIAAQHEDSSVQQEGRVEVSRWSKYLDKDSEVEEEEAGTERQQFCSRRENAVKKQRKHQKSFLSTDVQEYAEEHGVSQLAYQAKKVKTSEHRTCKIAVPDADDGGAGSGDSVVLAVCESTVPEENTQTPTACTKPSKWEKFLTCSDNYSGNAARVALSPQEGSGMLGLHSTTAPGTTGPSISCSVEDVPFKEPQSQVLRAGSGVAETAAGTCCLDSTRRANALVNGNIGQKPSSMSWEPLFCTGEEFNDDL